MFGFIFYLIIIWIVVYNVFYRKCPQNSALVIYDRADKKALPKVITEGGAFVNPINQDFKIISFKRTKINIDLKKVLVKQSSYRININMTFVTGCSKNPLLLKNAALEIMDLTQFEISKQARETIENQLKLVCALYTKEEIAEGKEFLRYLEKSTNSVLGAIGMEVTNIFINSVTDNTGEIKPQKQPAKKQEKPVKQSFEQEFGEIARKELQQKEEEKQEINEAYSALFANDSFEEFKKKTKQEQETKNKQELKEVIEKAVEKTDENIKEQSTEQTQTSAESSVEPSAEPSAESAPSNDVFASVRHYFENKNQ